MVRLISSRLHRCYSRRSVARSARLEKLSAVLHVLAVAGLAVHNEWGSFFNTATLAAPPPVVLIGGSLLLILVHTIDFYATLVAHRKFYCWPRGYKRTRGVLSSPTKVDALVVAAYLSASAVLLAASIGIGGPSWMPSNVPPRIDVAFSAMCALAAALNLVLSLPSLDFGIPLSLARLHNFIAGVFCIASVTKLQCALVSHLPDISPDITRLQARICLIADVAIVLAAVANFVRTLRFLAKTRYWAMDNGRNDTERTKKGLLSWFKSSTASANGSDPDSDIGDDYQGYDDDEIKKPTPKRANV